MTPYQLMLEENAKLRGQIADLEHAVSMLKRELRIHADECEEGLIQSRLRVTPHHALILYALWRAYPRPLTELHLGELLHGDRDRATNTVRVQVCKLRGTIGRDSIETVFGRGYRLTQQGAERVRSALGAIAA